MALDGKGTLALAAAGGGAIKDGKMLGIEAGGAFERHRSAGIFIGKLDVAPRKTDLGQEIEIRLVEPLSPKLQHVNAESLPQRPFVEGEFDVEGRYHRLLGGGDLVRSEAACRESLVVYPRSPGERAASHGIIDDALGRGLVIAERAQSLRHHAVDDLEIAAAGELLEFDQREIRLDPGRVAIHDEA